MLTLLALVLAVWTLVAAVCVAAWAAAGLLAERLGGAHPSPHPPGAPHRHLRRVV